MTIEGALRAHLLADGAIAALVGTQVYPDVLPQKTLVRPDDVTAAIVYQRVSTVREAHLRGQGSFARVRMQVDAWARTKSVALSAAAAIRRRLEGWQGTWTDVGSPSSAVNITILFDGEQSLVEPEINGGLCRQSMDYFVLHSTAEGLV